MDLEGQIKMFCRLNAIFWLCSAQGLIQETFGWKSLMGSQYTRSVRRRGKKTSTRRRSRIPCVVVEKN